jgi:nucleotide-binding universal stress UspA family protein
MQIKRILVPVDFSAHSLQALDYAVDLSKPFKAQLMVLHVVEPIYYEVPDFAGAAGAAMAGVFDDLHRTAHEQLVRLTQLYAKRRVTLRALLQTGTAHESIADTAKQLKADLIVMATHGRTGLTRLLIGSVAERVVRTATCPVLTLRAGQKPRRSAARKRLAARPRARK